MNNYGAFVKKYAIISVSDKTNLIEFAKGITGAGYSILASGGTAKVLVENNIECREVTELTGFPEVFDGRVKTLHPKIFGGILYRRENEKDKKEAADNGIETIDIVCVNLYPFAKTAARKDATEDELIENIDIGGPSLIRAAAKNNNYVSVLTDPAQYNDFLEALSAEKVDEQMRKHLAVAAFSHTAEYDTLIANTLEQRFDVEPSAVRLNYKTVMEMRYGENPHQKAFLYGNFFDYFEKLHGKELSYNNILDLVAAVELNESLGKFGCSIIKHQNPCGAAIGSSTLDAYNKALSCDPVSAFGGIVVFNETVDIETAEKVHPLFLEVLSAPGYTDEALALLMKKKNRRLLKQLKTVTEPVMQYKSIPGGILAQDADMLQDDFSELKTVTKREPTEKELEDLHFAWLVAKHVKSNAIVYVKDRMAIGSGGGQVSRIDSVKIGAMKAKAFGFDLKGSVVASDAFFPFPDGVEELAENGATAVIQPGGSVRDEEVIEAADKFNISMVFTGKRHFKH